MKNLAQGAFMRISIVNLVVSCLCVVSCVAQTASNGGSTTQEINAQNANNVCRIYFSMPKPGMDKQYEAGRKKHMQFHRDQKDTWTWNTFAIETGDHAGMYVTSSCGHSWKDFDEWEARMGKADTADGATNLSPYVQSGHNGFYVYRSDMSLAPANQPAAPITAVTIYVLHPGAVPDFIAAIKKVNDALGKLADWPRTGGWLQLINGGEGPTFALLNSRKNWADFAPLPKTVADVLNDTYGKETADQIQKTIRDCTAHQYTEAATYRADLSYLPGK
jgi:hypothetical protein